MTIAGKNKLEYKNVLVGEVWVAFRPVQHGMVDQRQQRRRQEVGHRGRTNPKLRMFTVVKNPQTTQVDDVKGSWVEADPKTVAALRGRLFSSAATSSRR